MPKVTVVITCFNYGAYLEEAARSVLGQTLTDLEVLIVDDGSTDDSLAVARRVAAGDARVEVIAQENSGQPAIPRNRAIERARGEYVVCLDADDVLHPEMVARCAATLDAEPRAGMANPQLEEFGDGDAVNAQLGWSLERLRHGNVYPCTTMFRRRAWADAGGYRLNVRGYEDWDLWLGIAEAGWEARPAAGARFFYRKHGSGVYAESVARDLDLKAQVVLNRSGVYTDAQVRWARGVLAQDPAALAVPHEFGLVPELRDPWRPPRVSRDRRERADWHLLADGEVEPPFAGALELADRLGYTAIRRGEEIVLRKRATDPRVFPIPFFAPGEPRADALASAAEALVVAAALRPATLERGRVAAFLDTGEEALPALLRHGLALAEAPTPILPSDAARADAVAALLAADRTVAGDPEAAARHAAVRLRAARAGSELQEARRVAILAFGDELVADPALLEAYGTAFGEDDDVTLVVATTDTEALVAAVGAAGLDGDGSPDLLAVSAAPAGVDAVFSRRPDAGADAPRFDDTSLAGLRALAA